MLALCSKNEVLNMDLSSAMIRRLLSSPGT